MVETCHGASLQPAKTKQCKTLPIDKVDCQQQLEVLNNPLHVSPIKTPSISPGNPVSTTTSFATPLK